MATSAARSQRCEGFREQGFAALHALAVQDVAERGDVVAAAEVGGHQFAFD